MQNWKWGNVSTPNCHNLGILRCNPCWTCSQLQLHTHWPLFSTPVADENSCKLLIACDAMTPLSLTVSIQQKHMISPNPAQGTISHHRFKFTLSHTAPQSFNRTLPSKAVNVAQWHEKQISPKMTAWDPSAILCQRVGKRCEMFGGQCSQERL